MPEIYVEIPPASGHHYVIAAGRPRPARASRRCTPRVSARSDPARYTPASLFWSGLTSSLLQAVRHLGGGGSAWWPREARVAEGAGAARSARGGGFDSLAAGVNHLSRASDPAAARSSRRALPDLSRARAFAGALVARDLGQRRRLRHDLDEALVFEAAARSRRATCAQVQAPRAPERVHGPPELAR